jgi:hypothetical protein
VPASVPSLGIVIVTYNSRADIGPCLTSLAAMEDLRPPIVVVDNASTDGTAAYVRAQHPSVTLIEAGENRGFAHANNAGAAVLHADLLLFLNPDTLVPPGALSRLVEVMVEHPDAAIVGPRLVDGDGRPELSFGPPISPFGEFRQKMLLWMYNRRVPLAVRHVERVTNVPGPRAWVSGACLLIRRSDWDAVGGFDSRFFIYTEDVDLCTRVRRRGRTVWFSPAASVTHLRGQSAARNPDTERLRRLSHIAFYQQHQPHWVWLLKLYLRVSGRGGHG